jgi:hypothetical protein
VSTTRELLWLRDENAALRRRIDAYRAGLRGVAGFLRNAQRLMSGVQTAIDQVEDMLGADPERGG